MTESGIGESGAGRSRIGASGLGGHDAGEPEISELLDGNRSWAASRRHQDPDAFRELASLHAPPFLLVGCCDARKPMDLVTGARPGRIFLHRNVANQVRPRDPAIGASFEFALGVLGVRHLIVCGHTGCGGIQASLGEDTGGDLSEWLEPIRRLAAEERERLDALETLRERADLLAELNVVRQLDHALRHPAVQARLRDPDRPLRIHGWIFCIETGLIETLPLPEDRWRAAGLLP